MYKCISCNEKTEKYVNRYDGYDRDIYKACPCCGGDLAEAEASCKLCGGLLFGGEKAIEIGTALYCTECAVEVEI